MDPLNLLIAALGGFASSFVGSIPVAGPLAVLAIASATRGELASARHLVRGGAVGEGTYAVLAFLGLRALVEAHPWILGASKLFTAALLIAIGIALLRTNVGAPRPQSAPARPGAAKKSVLIGFTITICNPTLLVSWSAVVTALYSFQVVRFSLPAALAFGAGAIGGKISWFHVLFRFIEQRYDRMERDTLKSVMRTMAACATCLGLWLAWRAI